MSSTMKEFLTGIQEKKNRQLKKDKVIMAEELHRQNILNLKIIVIIDISGSIHMSQYNSFISQLRKIKGLSKIRVFEVDTDICAMYDFEIIDSKMRSQIVHLGGSGGTNFVSAFEVVKKCHPDAILLFTDGCDGGDVKNPGIPTAAVLTVHGSIDQYPWITVVGRVDN